MTTNFNPSSAKGKNFKENWVNTMAVDVLPPYVTSSSAVTVLTKYNNQVQGGAFKNIYKLVNWELLNLYFLTN